MIKYKYAWNSENEIIRIESLNRLDKTPLDKFVCISCNKELIPRLGKIRIKHFSHKEEVVCSGETYLHKLGKNLFYKEYQRCLTQNLPFYIEFYENKICSKRKSEFGIECNLGKTLSKFDLTRYFSEISMETREGSFIPDILLKTENGKEKIFFEIAVTHFSTVEKLNAGYRLIELRIEDEEDLGVINEHCISIGKSDVSFTNFKIKSKTAHFCQNLCEKTFDFFRIDKEGKARLHQQTLSQISYILKKDKETITHFEISPDNGNYPLKYKYLVAKAFNEKKKLKNCFLCRYHGINKEWESEKYPIFCKFLKTISNSNEAAICNYFQPEKEYVDRYIQNGNFISPATIDEENGAENI